MALATAQDLPLGRAADVPAAAASARQGSL
jgi:hypothetical protein